jgi:cytochrome oxidase Cu insertion factor (SCO1/SenC/PrrC family)
MFGIRRVKGALAISAAGLAAASLVALWVLSGFGRSSGDLPPSAEAIGGSFQLTGANGQRVSDRDFRGKWLLVYFGYTHCPDICPTTLVEISQTLKLLGDDAARIQPLFISIDPERDTPQIVGEYVKQFDDRIIGLAGTPEEIATAAKAYHVFYAKEEGVDTGNYFMQHTAFVYVMDPDGRYVTLLSPLQGQTPEVMAIRLREFVSMVRTGHIPPATAAPSSSLSHAVAVSPRAATPAQ